MRSEVRPPEKRHAIFTDPFLRDRALVPRRARLTKLLEADNRLLSSGMLGKGEDRKGSD